MAQPAVRRTTNFVRANKDIIGTKVVNPQHEDLGKIEDLIVDSSGRVSYAVLSFGGFLGMGDKDFAIPFNAFAFDPANNRIFVQFASPTGEVRGETSVAVETQ